MQALTRVAPRSSSWWFRGSPLMWAPAQHGWASSMQCRASVVVLSVASEMTADLIVFKLRGSRGMQQHEPKVWAKARMGAATRRPVHAHVHSEGMSPTCKHGATSHNFSLWSSQARCQLTHCNKLQTLRGCSGLGGHGPLEDQEGSDAARCACSKQPNLAVDQ